jgi:hypothetical protein
MTLLLDYNRGLPISKAMSYSIRPTNFLMKRGELGLFETLTPSVRPF